MPTARPDLGDVVKYLAARATADPTRNDNAEERDMALRVCAKMEEKYTNMRLVAETVARVVAENGQGATGAGGGQDTASTIWASFNSAWKGARFNDQSKPTGQRLREFAQATSEVFDAFGQFTRRPLPLTEGKVMVVPKDVVMYEGEIELHVRARRADLLDDGFLAATIDLVRRRLRKARRPPPGLIAPR